MNKTEKNITILIISIIMFLCPFVFSGCGLDVYYVLEAPTIKKNYPTTSSEFDERYFDFVTNDEDNKGYLKSANQSFVYLGTAVYYKIYNNSSTLSSQYSAIEALNEDEEDYGESAEKMIDSYGFKQLGTSGGTITPLIAADSTNREVKIRLTNYGSQDEYQAYITVDGEDLTNSSGTIVVPRRVQNNHTFDFGRDGDNDEVPSEDDDEDDVKYSSSFSDDDDECWYVAMYAVAVGRDETYSKSYSFVLYLGAVTIDASEEDN